MKKFFGDCALGFTLGTLSSFPGLVVAEASKNGILGCVYTLLFGLLILGIVRRENKHQRELYLE